MLHSCRKPVKTRNTIWNANLNELFLTQQVKPNIDTKCQFRFFNQHIRHYTRFIKLLHIVCTFSYLHLYYNTHPALVTVLCKISCKCCIMVTQHVTITLQIYSRWFYLKLNILSQKQQISEQFFTFNVIVLISTYFLKLKTNHECQNLVKVLTLNRTVSTFNFIGPCVFLLVIETARFQQILVPCCGGTWSLC